MRRKTYFLSTTPVVAPPYIRPEPTALILAVAQSGVPNPKFKRSMMSDEDVAYLEQHGMPNGAVWAIVDDQPVEGFTAVVG